MLELPTSRAMLATARPSCYFYLFNFHVMRLIVPHFLYYLLYCYAVFCRKKTYYWKICNISAVLFCFSAYFTGEEFMCMFMHFDDNISLSNLVQLAWILY